MTPSQMVLHGLGSRTYERFLSFLVTDTEKSELFPMLLPRYEDELPTVQHDAFHRSQVCPREEGVQ